MSAEDFLLLVIHPENVAVSDLQALEELNRQYPYSQIIHFLVAKVYHDIGSQQAFPRIKRAAIYATHREALKSVLDKKQTGLAREKRLNVTDYQLAEDKKEVSTAIETEFKAESAAVTSNLTPPKEDIIPVRRSNFITLETDLQLTVDESVFTVVKTENEVDNEQDTLEKRVESLLEDREKMPDFGSLETDDSVSDFLIQQIPTLDDADTTDEDPPLKIGFLNYEEVETLAILQNRKLGKDEQMEIIDNFIKKDPRLSPLTYVEKEENTSKKDLSERNQPKDDGFVSESLANIMLKQGKTQRAIEIFEKLILKNPEKRTYFATRIDELRQKL